MKQHVVMSVPFVSCRLQWQDFIKAGASSTHARVDTSSAERSVHANRALTAHAQKARASALPHVAANAFKPLHALETKFLTRDHANVNAPMVSTKIVQKDSSLTLKNANVFPSPHLRHQHAHQERNPAATGSRNSTLKLVSVNASSISQRTKVTTELMEVTATAAGVGAAAARVAAVAAVEGKRAAPGEGGVAVAVEAEGGVLGAVAAVAAVESVATSQASSLCAPALAIPTQTLKAVSANIETLMLPLINKLNFIPLIDFYHVMFIVHAEINDLSCYYFLHFLWVSVK